MGGDQARCLWWQDEPVVMRTLAFVFVRQVLGLIGLGPTPDAKDVEIAVLRHQLAVLRRQIARARYTPNDRIVLATLAKLLPRDRRSILLVTPSTLLRWHRELVIVTGSYPRRTNLLGRVAGRVITGVSVQPIGWVAGEVAAQVL
jgi:hypothetical protein